MRTTSLPSLDISHYHTPAERPAFLQALRHAARDVGFFYLTHHGISEALQQAVSQEARHFFPLNDQQKQQVAMIHSPHFRGYNR
ncbi:2-oxoglutarate and iron-dependent oxygenase domain-containing protein, partial [Yokenella regensburgei]|uniref:2-oxoglutarate and iron-dependent oxygenase domain-containing protein n=1 Tax=Yokenella regensburgei TaxID=158877 RepID=UPI003ED9A55D